MYTQEVKEKADRKIKAIMSDLDLYEIAEDEGWLDEPHIPDFNEQVDRWIAQIRTFCDHYSDDRTEYEEMMDLFADKLEKKFCERDRSDFAEAVVDPINGGLNM